MSPTKAARGATPRLAKDIFSEQINRLSDNDGDDDRWRQGVISDLIVDAHPLEHLEGGARARSTRARRRWGIVREKKSQIWPAGGLISHLRWSIGSKGELRFGRCRAVGAARREK